jgi:preprotein translocase subunit YajC
MLITPAYAQSLALPAGLSNISQFLPLILIFVVFYFILIRPQQQKQKEVKAQLASLKRGDRVVTGGGLIGVVQRVKEGSNEIEVEIAPNVRVMVVRETINTVLKPTAANDTKPAAKT